MAWNALWSNSSSTRGVLMFDLFSFSLCNNVLSGCRQCPERAGRIWPSAVHSSQGTNFYFLYSKSYVNLISECVTGSSPDWSDLQIGEARWVRRGTKRTWKVLLIVKSICTLSWPCWMLSSQDGCRSCRRQIEASRTTSSGTSSREGKEAWSASYSCTWQQGEG